MKKEPNKSLLVVYTGDGKGKTTAALGMVLRAIGYNWRVCIVQFVKGSWKYGELEGIKRLGSEVELHVVGEGFVGIVDDTKEFAEHQRAAAEGVELARELILSGRHRLIILDELSVALSLKLISREQIEELIAARNDDQHMVITGRGAPDWLIEKADLVTEMKEVKHPFKKGIPACKGIDW